VLSVAISPDGAWVVSGSKDRGVQFWNPKDAQAQLMLQGHKNSGESRRHRSELPHSLERFCCLFLIVISLDLSPAGGLLATGSGDWQARVCKLPFPPSGVHQMTNFCRRVHVQGATLRFHNRYSSNILQFSDPFPRTLSRCHLRKCGAPQSCVS